MTIIDLHNAVRALLPAGVTHYLGQAPASPEAPWIVSSFERQESELSEVSTLSAFTDAITVTVAGLTEDQTNFWTAAVCDALTGAPVSVAGWSIGAIQAPSVRGPYLAGLTALDTNLRYQVARVTFRFTVSKTA